MEVIKITNHMLKKQANILIIETHLQFSGSVKETLRLYEGESTNICCATFSLETKESFKFFVSLMNVDEIW